MRKKSTRQRRIKRISQHKRLEKALRESEQRFELAMRGSNDGLWDWNLETNEAYFSPRWKEILGYTDEELVNHFDEWHKRLHPEDFEQVMQEIDAYLEKRSPNYESIHRLQHKEGHYVWVLVRGLGVWGKTTNQATRFIGTYVDLTAQKNIEAELRQTKKAAEAANFAKTAFLANMSHELRTPLNGILGYAQLLSSRDDLTTTQQGNVNIIQRNGEYLLLLINDILDFAKMEQEGITELFSKNIHLPKFLYRLTELFQWRASQKGLSFVYQPSSFLPRIVSVDEKRLRQILVNLLSNAVKFTQKGGVIFKVEHFLGKIYFQIEDTGIGIAKAELERIFVPFYQTTTDLYDYREGTGIGLAITKKLVEIMAGELLVESCVGYGSSFTVTLNLPEVKEFSDSSPEIERKMITGYQNSDKKQYRILIIDDEQTTYYILENTLTKLNFSVLWAKDGREGLNLIESYRPDIILLDLVMPIMDGFEVMRRLRIEPAYKQMPIIVISVGLSDSACPESWEINCDAIIVKPVQVNKLLELLQTYLKLSWIYAESEECSPISPEIIEPTVMIQDSQPMVYPTTEQVDILLELAMMGDMQGILELADKLEQENSELAPFIKKLRQMAKDFQEELICEFIQQIIQQIKCK